ncbi:hypothetical protein FPE01S_02_04460 [Flavihumibacter petaseus NBRC 106054]|uniref:Uncharacterized protein n=2 Tax=Flavihumibacter TaxID=1004301 RepID=A0A0E9N108_9BACT|nr:hypothetical protein FPE01S_02_04460 [Flavihumibacter petaseus NBRC 106054]
MQVTNLDTNTANQADSFNQTQPKLNNDYTTILFGDSSYILILHLFDTTNNYDAEKNNTILTFSKKGRNQTKALFRDSMFCMYQDIDFKDFNNDKIADITVFYYTGARANPTYHLYLTDLKNHRLIRVKDFEELPNPDLDTTNNIITSIALSGTNYYSFYRIDTKNKLKNLGHSFNENPNDSTQYEKAIRQILKK